MMIPNGRLSYIWLASAPFSCPHSRGLSEQLAMRTSLIGQAMSNRRAAIALAIGLLIGGNISAQDLVPGATAAPPPEPVGATAEVERVIVTGSNIPTAEEVGPNPVDTYRSEDIQKLGVRTPTDLAEKLPVITGFAVNENIANGGDGRTEVNLRGLFPKETLVLVEPRRRRIRSLIL
jgi:iron complex outermembrane receptor protein